MPTMDYLEEMLKKAKKYLPYDLFKQLYMAARARAGGLARWRNDKNNQVTKELTDDLETALAGLGYSIEIDDPENEIDEQIQELKVLKADEEKQLVYGIVMEPEEVDTQNEIVSAAEIEKAAHEYLIKSRIIAGSHKKKIKAEVVESYIAPLEFELNEQKIKKGSWLMTVHVNDKDEWQKVKEKGYDGFSIGGYAKKVIR